MGKRKSKDRGLGADTVVQCYPACQKFAQLQNLTSLKRWIPSVICVICFMASWSSLFILLDNRCLFRFPKDTEHPIQWFVTTLIQCSLLFLPFTSSTHFGSEYSTHIQQNLPPWFQMPVPCRWSWRTPWTWTSSALVFSLPVDTWRTFTMTCQQTHRTSSFFKVKIRGENPAYLLSSVALPRVILLMSFPLGYQGQD